MSHVEQERGITSIQFAFWFGPVGGSNSDARRSALDARRAALDGARRAALDASSGRCFCSSACP